MMKCNFFFFYSGRFKVSGTDKGRERHYLFVGKGELDVPSRVLFSLKLPCRYKHSNSKDWSWSSFFKAHEQTNINDVFRITCFVAAFLTYTAFHLRLLFTLVHTRLIYWWRYRNYIFFNKLNPIYFIGWQNHAQKTSLLFWTKSMWARSERRLDSDMLGGDINNINLLFLSYILWSGYSAAA